VERSLETVSSSVFPAGWYGTTMELHGYETTRLNPDLGEAGSCQNQGKVNSNTAGLA